MKIKMVDVARYLGVSKATVSLAVNGKPGVNEETRKKVLACIEEIEKMAERSDRRMDHRQWTTGSRQRIKGWRTG